MRRCLRLILPALAVVLATGRPTPSQPTTAIFPLRGVRAGQPAVGKSVFRGTKIESFNLQIIGVWHKYEGTRSMILARILDGPVVKRQSGLIGGMSGSPIYIQGRLAGAIAYGWAFNKEPIAGIVPIEEMLQAWREKPAPPGEAEAAGLSSPPPMAVGGEKITHMRIAPALPGQRDPAGTMTLTPLGGFLQVSGFSRRTVQRLSEFFQPYGTQVLQGGAGAEDRISPPLVPGAAVGAQLVGGDLDITELGTVTLVDGKRVLAFGHPLFELGAVDMPMTGAYVYDIMPSVYFSNKLMAATRVVGAMYRDHAAGVAGEIGRQSDLLPLTVEVQDRDLGRTRKFSLRVVRIKELTPILVAMSVMTAVDETRGRVAKGSASVRLELEAEGRPPLVREERGYNQTDAADVALPVVLEPLVTFTDNQLGALKMKRIKVKVETATKRDTATIERLRVADSRVKAGDDVTLTVTIRPYGKPPVDVPVTLTLPPDLPRGSVRVVISSGRDGEDARSSLGAPRPRPVSLDQLVARYLSVGKSTDLMAQAALTRGGAALLGEELPGLPRSALNALRATKPSDLRPIPSVIRLTKPTEWVLSGRQMVTLQVESPAAAAGPPRMEPPKGPEGEEGKPSEEEGGPEEFDFALMAAEADWPELSALAAPAEGEEEAGEEEETQPTDTPKPEAKAKPAEGKPLARAPLAWVHRTKNDYAKAELAGAAVREDGCLCLSLTMYQPAEIPADVIWSVAVRDGAAYVGTGSKGVIYRVSPAGEVSQFFATGEMNVHDLEFDTAGNLYAATSPRGRLFRISPEGKGELVCDTESTFLWRLSMTPDGTIYAGGGPPARIYAISAKGEVKVLADLPAVMVVSLVRAAGAPEAAPSTGAESAASAGDLYAGTSEGGIVYRVRADGSTAAVCQVSGTSVDSLAQDRTGNIYASGSPGGDIYWIPTTGLPGLYCKTDQDTVYGLAALPGGDMVAATGPAGLVLRVNPDRKTEVMVRPETGLATAISEADGAVYVGSSAPCTLRRLGPGYSLSGQLESAPLDAERSARWGRIEWTAELPEGTEVRAETRSGDSPDPRDHWNDWAPASAGVIVSPPARYLQYRLTLATKDTKVTPLVRTVVISRQPQNRPPTCGVKAPPAGEWIAKKYTVRWDGQDPDRDSLVYELSVSSDAGKTWKQLKKDLTEPQYEWDTSQSPGGRCLLRVTASDRQSRPDDPRTAEAVSVVGVDNSAPKVVVFESSVSVGADRRAQVKGLGTDDLSPIRSLEYRVDSGSWRSLPLALVGGNLSDLAVTTDALDPGSHTVEVRAFDSAGNMASDKATVKVEEAKAAPPAEQKPAGEEEKQADGGSLQPPPPPHPEPPQ